MAIYNGAYPVLPGKLDAGRAFAKEVMGARRSEYEASQKRGTVTRETWTVQENPDGTALVLVWFECDDPDKAMAEVGQDSSEFGVWFRERVKDVSGVDMTEPSDGGPEVIVDWSA